MDTAWHILSAWLLLVLGSTLLLYAAVLIGFAPAIAVKLIKSLYRRFRSVNFK